MRKGFTEHMSGGMMSVSVSASPLGGDLHDVGRYNLAFVPGEDDIGGDVDA